MVASEDEVIRPSDKSFASPLQLLSFLGVPATIALIASLLALRKRLPIDQQGSGSILTLSFVSCGIFGLVIVAAVQLVGSYVLLRILVGKDAGEYIKEFQRHGIDGLDEQQLSRRKAMAQSWRYLVFLFFFCYIMAGFIEEFLKYVPLVYASWANDTGHSLSTGECVVYAVTAALGFGTLEMIGFVYAAIKTGEIEWRFVLTMAERLLISVPGHMLVAALTAIRAARRGTFDLTLTALLMDVGPSTLYHGTFDFVLFVVCARNGNVGWIHPKDAKTTILTLAVVLGIQAVCWLQVRSSWPAES